jgi:hypothetical protein
LDGKQYPYSRGYKNMTLFLSDYEARSFAQGGRVLWRKIPDDLQPYEVEGWWYITARDGKPFHSIDGSACSEVITRPVSLLYPELASVYPYQPGSPVDLKETWAALGEDYRPCNPAIAAMWSYKADHITGNDGPDTILWHSPVTMPRAAVRWHMTVVSVEVKERDGVWGWKITMEER